MQGLSTNHATKKHRYNQCREPSFHRQASFRSVCPHHIVPLFQALEKAFRLRILCAQMLPQDLVERGRWALSSAFFISRSYFRQVNLLQLLNDVDVRTDESVQVLRFVPAKVGPPLHGSTGLKLET